MREARVLYAHPVAASKMRLEELSLPSSTLQALHAAGESVESLLCHRTDIPPPHLPPTIFYNALQAIHTLATRPSPIPVFSTRLSSGSAVFDAHASLRSRAVIQICGRSGAGKTALCVALAAATLRQAQSVFWIDSGAGLWQVRTAVRRWASVNRLTVISVCSVSHALRELTRLTEQLHVLSMEPKPSLLVFDSPAALLAPVLGLKGSAGWSGHVAMQHLTAAINNFVTLSAATVLLTNRVVDGATRPALGNIWSALVDEQLLLRRVQTDDEQRLEIGVTKTSKKSAACHFSLVITENGITDNDGERTQVTQQSSPS